MTHGLVKFQPQTFGDSTGLVRILMMGSSNKESHNFHSQSIGEHEHFKELMDQMKNYIWKIVAKMFAQQQIAMQQRQPQVSL